MSTTDLQTGHTLTYRLEARYLDGRHCATLTAETPNEAGLHIVTLCGELGSVETVKATRARVIEEATEDARVRPIGCSIYACDKGTIAVEVTATPHPSSSMDAQTVSGPRMGDPLTEAEARAEYDRATRLRANCAPGTAEHVRAQRCAEHAYDAIQRFREELTEPREPRPVTHVFTVPAKWRTRWPCATLTGCDVVATIAPNGDLTALRVTRGDVEVEDGEAAELTAAIEAYGTIEHARLDDFLTGYIECAIWSSTDQEAPLDIGYAAGDLAPETAAAMRSQCSAFIASNPIRLAEHALLTDRDWASLGHDFWLTRNGHGAGYWDRHMEATPGHRKRARQLGDALSEAARLAGPSTLYPGDDGQLYIE